MKKYTEKYEKRKEDIVKGIIALLNEYERVCGAEFLSLKKSKAGYKFQMARPKIGIN